MSTTIHTVTKDELASKLGNDPSAQVINVLDTDHFNLGMIRGTTRLPLSQIDRRIGELDRNREVITYCASRECPASRMAAEKLADAGFDVKAYEGGIKEWKAAGLPTEA